MTDTPATTPGNKDTGKDVAKTKASTDKKPVSPVHKKKTSGKSSPFAGQYLAKLALVASLFLAAGLYYLYSLWQNQASQFPHFEQQINRLDQHAEQSDKNLADTSNAIRQQINAARQQQNELSEAVADMLRTSRHLRSDWLMAEAEYLVNLAGHRLALSRDIPTAIAALKSADQRLLDAGDPALIPVRKAIAEDITTLKTVEQPDIAGISLKLSSLVGEVEHLRLLTPKPAAEKYQQDESSERDIESWNELPGAIWTDLKGLVTIRDHQGPIKPLLSPEQHFFLTQNLKLQLEQARLALLSGETQVYEERLATVKNWLETWFDLEDHKNAQVLNELESIGDINIRPDIPNLSRSHKAFKLYQQEQSVPKASKKKPVEKPDNAEPAPVLPSPSSKQVPL